MGKKITWYIQNSCPDRKYLYIAFDNHPTLEELIINDSYLYIETKSAVFTKFVKQSIQQKFEMTPAYTFRNGKKLEYHLQARQKLKLPVLLQEYLSIDQDQDWSLVLLTLGLQSNAPVQAKQSDQQQKSDNTLRESCKIEEQFSQLKQQVGYLDNKVNYLLSICDQD